MRTFFKDTAVLVSGSFIFSLAVVIFAKPNIIPTGGASGIAIILNYLFSIPTGTAIFLINIPLFITAMFVCKLRFTIKTVYATAIFSLITDLSEQIISFAFTSDKLLAAISGGVISGLGMYIIFSNSLVTGGSDLLAYIFQKLRPGKRIGTLILAIDGAVVVLSGVVFRSFNIMLYSLVLASVSAITINSLLRGRTEGLILFILSSRPVEIRESIMTDFGRGVSVIDATGGYTGEERKILFCAVKTREVSMLKRLVFSRDADAFVVVADASDVCGNGFYDFKNEGIF